MRPRLVRRLVQPSAEDQAELVAFRVGHQPPPEAVLLEVGSGRSSPAELLDPLAAPVEVLDDDVEMEAILAGLRFGDALEREPRPPGDVGDTTT